MTQVIDIEAEESVQRMNRDLINAAKLVTSDEARFLVDTYYSIQDFRIQSMNQVRTLIETEEPNSVLRYTANQMEILEKQVARALAAFSSHHPVGQWAESIVGIGPVLSAGLLAHINIRKCGCQIYRDMKPIPTHDCPGLATAGHIWRYAGLDPTSVWEKGQKRPWNARLKVICWKIGESFVKVQNNPNDIYGKMYVARKEIEIRKNENLDFADQAKSVLEKKRIRKDTEAYKWYSQGKLPPAHIHARAKRKAVSIFLAHWHHVAYEIEFGKKPPKPYVIDHMGHTDYLAPPNWPMNKLTTKASNRENE